MPTAFVTGGSGFVGSLLIARLLAEGYRVASYDRLPCPVQAPDLSATIGDLRDKATLAAAIGDARPDVVFHCAADLAHGRMRPSELWSSNVDGTRSLAEALATSGVCHLVYLSSNCLWGTGFDRPVTEQDVPAPVEIYGDSKWEGEKILLAHAGVFHTTVIRCPTIIDEGRLGLLTILFEFIAEHRTVWVVGGGRNRYQFIHAGDLIDAMLRACRRETSAVYGIGSDDVATMRDVYGHVIAGSGSRSRIASLPKAPTLLAMRLAHALRISPLGPYHYRMIASDFVFDTHRIKAELGWRPSVTNGEMLLQAYRHYLAERAHFAERRTASAHRRPADMGVIRLLKWVS